MSVGWVTPPLFGTMALSIGGFMVDWTCGVFRISELKRTDRKAQYSSNYQKTLRHSEREKKLGSLQLLRVLNISEVRRPFDVD